MWSNTSLWVTPCIQILWLNLFPQVYYELWCFMSHISLSTSYQESLRVHCEVQDMIRLGCLTTSHLSISKGDSLIKTVHCYLGLLEMLWNKKSKTLSFLISAFQLISFSANMESVADVGDCNLYNWTFPPLCHGLLEPLLLITYTATLFIIVFLLWFRLYCKPHLTEGILSKWRRRDWSSQSINASPRHLQTWPRCHSKRNIARFGLQISSYMTWTLYWMNVTYISG